VASESGTDVALAGHELTLSPHLLCAAALLFAPPSGLGGSLVATYVGRRYLDLANQAPTPAYLIVDATIGLPLVIGYLLQKGVHKKRHHHFIALAARLAYQG